MAQSQNDSQFTTNLVRGAWFVLKMVKMGCFVGQVVLVAGGDADWTVGRSKTPRLVLCFA